MTVHPIEEESYRILSERLDLSRWEPGPAAVVARVVHATAEVALADALVCPPDAVDAGVAALATGAPVLCDVEMVRAGISGARVLCASAAADDAAGDAAAQGAGEPGEGRAFPSRTAGKMAALAARHPEGAVVVVGCAPTALAEVCRLVEGRRLRPALVVGVPVGFVGADASKAQLLDVAARAGVPAITLRGERGGAAVAAAIVNALARLHSGPPARPPAACLFIGHGTRSDAGAAELRAFASAAAAARPAVPSAAGYIEFVEPGLDDAIDGLVAAGARDVAAVPLVLFGAGHLKDDGPAALARARQRHPGVAFTYGRDLGLHPAVLDAVGDRAREAAAALATGHADALVVVGRGSSDPDANGDLAKAARLLADGRLLARPAPPPGRAAGAAREGAGAPAAPGARRDVPPLALVVPSFVSLAEPSVPDALDQCAALGARQIAVVPYFLFDGLLVERIRAQTAAWAAGRPGVATAVGRQIGIDPRVVDLAWHRYDQALAGEAHMNCDGCLYRTPLPGYAGRVGTRPEL